MEPDPNLAIYIYVFMKMLNQQPWFWEDVSLRTSELSTGAVTDPVTLYVINN